MKNTLLVTFAFELSYQWYVIILVYCVIIVLLVGTNNKNSLCNLDILRSIKHKKLYCYCTFWNSYQTLNNINVNCICYVLSVRLIKILHIFYN